MRKLFILPALAISTLIASKASAQVSIHLGFHLPVPRVYVPAPPPVEVYDDQVYDDNAQVNYNYDGDDYYYLPEVEAYYSPAAHCYYYNDGNNWITCAYLPGAYRNYNWRTAVRYQVRGQRPYLRNDYYRQKWGGWNGDRSNWGRRFDRRSDGGYAYQNHDNRFNNRGWDRGRNNDRGNWGGRPSVRDDRGNWGGRPNQGGQDHGNQNGGGNQNHGGWGGGRPNQGGQDHGNQNGGGNQNHGGWGGRPNNGGQDHGNQNGGGNQNHGGWGGGQPNNGGQDHGNQNGGGNQNHGGSDQPNQGGQDHGNQNGGGRPSNNGGGRDRGGNGGSHFAGNQAVSRRG